MVDTKTKSFTAEAHGKQLNQWNWQYLNGCLGSITIDSRNHWATFRPRSRDDLSPTRTAGHTNLYLRKLTSTKTGVVHFRYFLLEYEMAQDGRRRTRVLQVNSVAFSPKAMRLRITFSISRKKHAFIKCIPS